jgi:hypothetical protein
VLVAVLVAAQTERPLSLPDVQAFYNSYAKDTGLQRKTEDEVRTSIEVLQQYSMLIPSSSGNFGGRRTQTAYRVNVKATEIVREERLEGVHKEQLRATVAAAERVAAAAATAGV